MSQVKNYRLKIYGTVSSDTDLFVKQMASLLGMDQEEFRALLHHVPAAVETPISGQIVDDLRKRIAEVGGLVLFEPWEPEDEALEPKSSPATPTAEMRGRQPKIGDTLQANLWLGAVVAISGSVALFILVAFVSTLWQTYRWNNPIPRKPALTASASASARGNHSAEASQEIEDRIRELKPTIEDLQYKLGEAQLAFRQLKTAHNIDRQYRLVRSKEIGDLRREITEKFTEMRKLELAAKTVEDKLTEQH